MKMKVSKIVDTKILIGLFIVFTLGLIIVHLSPGGKFIRLLKAEVKKEQQRKVRLLSETDHHALLKACRELSKRITEGNLEPNNYLVRYKPHPETSRFPQQILDIEPLRISLWSDGRVMVEMLGGLHHYGVTAYPENYEVPIQNFKYGDKQIINGLWYYEDGYNPRYNKWIEKQIQKNKMRNQIK